MNSIIIKGRLTRDPDLRHTQSGTPVANFTVAVDRRFKPKDGEEKQVDFIDCVAWRSNSEFVTKYFVKGQEIAVRGRMESRKWQDKEGNKRTSWEINVDEVDFCGPKSDRAPGDSSNTFHNSGTPVNVAADDYAELEDDGDLPF